MKKVYWQYNGYTVKNSVSFVGTVKELQISPRDHLVSFDVMNLFTQVPITEALEVIEEKLAGNQSLESRISIPVPHLVELVKLCLRSSYLQFQTHSTSRLMVQPWAPPLAHRHESVLRAPRRRSYSISITPAQTVAPLHG